MKNTLAAKWLNHAISPELSLLDASKTMDAIRRKLLLVMKGQQYIGLLSIGDIQRAIIKNVPLTDAVGDHLRNDIVNCKVTDDRKKIKSELLRCRAEYMPVVDEDGDLVDIHYWEDYFTEENYKAKTDLKNIPVVIMAGGEGTRLKPLTNILPKPLLPFGNKSIIEVIMDRFAFVGCNSFHISVKYKANLIRSYFDELSENNMNIKFHEESTPLGTAGGLSLIAKELNDPFFVSNCDIVIDQDLTEVVGYHQKNNNDITVIAALKHVQLPYGSLVTSEDGVLQSLDEKPEWIFKVNSGVYLLEPGCLKYLPKEKYFNMTDLIDEIMKNGGRVGVFPISEGSWVDIGTTEEYQKHLFA